MANVELNVRTQLNTIIKELEQIAQASNKVGDSLGAGTDAVGEGLKSQTEKTGRYLTNLQALGGRVASQMMKDFKALASINAVAGAVKFSNMLQGAVSQSFSLNDSMRKFSQILGIADSRRASFQANLVRGLGEIGLSADTAASSLEGLSKTSVRGEGNITAYSKTGGMLASLSREQGKEGEIEKGLSDVVTARGENPNDTKRMEAVSQDVRRVQLSTGRGATQILQSLNELFAGANQDFQGRLKKGGAVSLANAAMLGGPEATTFMERYLKSNRYERQSLNAMGLGNLMTEKGELNKAGISRAVQQAKGFGMGDAAAGFQVMNVPAEQAQGLIRLDKSFTEQRQAYERFERSRRAPVNLQKDYEQGRGFVEAWKGNVNSALSLTAPVTSRVSEYGARAMNATAKHPWAAAGVVGAAGLAAATLAGVGLRGLGKAFGLGGDAVGIAKGMAVGAGTGGKVQPVYVVNAKDMGGSGGIAGATKGLLDQYGKPILTTAGGGAAEAAGGGLLGGVAGKLLRFLGPAGALLGGVAAGSALAESDVGKGALALTTSKNSAGYEGDVIDRLLFKLDQLMGGKATGLSAAYQNRQDVRVTVESKNKDFKAVHEGSRGTPW